MLVRKISRKKKRGKDLFDEKFIKMWEFYMASCQTFRYRDLVVFQLQIIKNFHSSHRTGTIYIHKNCYLINSTYEKEKKTIKI